MVKMLGDYVAIGAYGSGNFNTYVNQLRTQGMVIGGFEASTRLVEGLLPISKLVAVAGLDATAGLKPQYYPMTRSVGAANNQADTAQLADVARTQFRVDGTGVIVGVLSDSVNKVGGGLADSIATNDLPNGINVLFDDDTGRGADEGRAMLELIHDIAPGSGLAYHNAFSLTGGETVMAAGIRRLATDAGARVITDDIGFADEYFYQNGPAANAITDVTQNNGVTYTSAAGNFADNGFESPFRGATTTVNGIGAGRFMDFDPTSGTNFLLPVTFTGPTLAVFQYDQPFGVVNGVTSDVDVFFVDANGATIASGITNNIATNQPLEIVQVPSAGNYFMVVQVKAGSADPGRMVSYLFTGDTNAGFSQQYGNAGGISYPTTWGHPTADAAIGTAAVAWYEAPAFPSGLTPTPSEDFSSFGPGVKVFNPDGSRKPSVQIQQTPVLSGADASNTTFFGSPPGSVPPGLPANNYTQPNFFGTSAAAPNVAAVAALMLQLSPTSSPADIRAGLISSTIPVNGTPKGTWDVQGGYGLIQAPAALAAVDNLRVVSVTPSDATGVTVPPQYLIVRFSRAVNINTLRASNLVFTATSAPGITVTVGQPLVSDVNNPTEVFYPLTFTVQPGFKANSAFAYTLRAGQILSRDGKPLVGFDGSFVVQDLAAPKVTRTAVLGRFVQVTFSEPMNPTTFTKNSFYLIRTGSSGVFGSPTNVVVNQSPALLVGYDQATNTAILDFTQVDQSQLPSDRYAIVVLDSVTDVVGNKLDGEFTSIFPSGNGQEGGNFTQDLGVIGLTAPQILSFSLAPASDTGIAGDENTKQSQPTFVGQVQSRFPGAIAGLTVVAQFGGLHNGALSLAQGLGGRGFSGSFDVTVVTDSQGRFSFQALAGLPSGFQTVRVVVVGASDAPPLPGLSTRADIGIRVDLNSPILTTSPNSLVQPNSRIPTLTQIVIDATDPVIPNTVGDPFAIPVQFSIPALNPASATNISNYALINLGSDNLPGGTGTAADVDFSGFITSAAYANGAVRDDVTDPYLGSITLSFAQGVPAGRYVLFARQPVAGLVPGITDAAGNPIFAQNGGGPLNQDFTLQFDLQPTPVYITSVTAATPNDAGTGSDPDTRPNSGQVPGGGFDLSGPKSYFEIAVPGTTARATAAPTKFSVDFSTPLGGTADYTGKVFLIRSSNSAVALSDGDFGTDPTFQSGVGYTIVPTTVTAINSVLGAEFGQPGFRNRLLIEIPEGTSLPADHYRLYIPNAVRNNGTDLRIFDTFGNQLDGEFLGNPTPNGDGTYENLLGNGQIRANSMSGDGVAGGGFETGYTIVPNGNVIFVRPDYIDNQFLTDDDPDGSFAKPFSSLAPEAVSSLINNGDLNSQANFGQNFDIRYDRNGNNRFDRSAFVAASQRSAFGPVVIIAQPSISDTKLTYVLQAPSGTDPVVNDGSATLSYNTTLVFQPGSALKFRNASLFIQNQGSSLQVRGGPNPLDQVYFTSYADDSVGGDTNRDGVSTGTGGDWGGIVFRNFDDTSTTFPNNPNGRTVPGAPGPKDPLRAKLGFSGADEALSYINQASIRFAGGAVPQTIGFRYDAITNFNARPAITNVTISQTGGSNSAQAAISGDVDSFREDDLSRGLLVRRANVFSNSINGIYVRAELNGVAMPTDAVNYVNNAPGLGGTRNYSFFAPLPYVLVSRLEVGRTLQQANNGATSLAANRFYFQPGTVMKFQRGAAIDVVNVNASINIGDRTYIRQFDGKNNFAPGDAGFHPADFGDAPVLFTSFFDDNATTAYRDPTTGRPTTVVAAIDSDSGGAVNLPVAGNVPALARWGGISVISGAVAVMDEATLQFGGGSVNSAAGTIGQRDVLAFQGAASGRGQNLFRGTRAYVTNNNFFDNLEAPISVDPNGLLATDPLRPLISGNPFFRGNVMLRNAMNGLEVLPEVGNNGGGGLVQGQTGNLFVSSVWDDTDLTYILRSTIRLAGFERQSFGTPLPAFPVGGFEAELTPSVVLTIQSSLPDSRLANGQSVPRPGESVIVKLLNTSTVLGDGVNGMPAGNVNSDTQGGAGFIAGADDGSDPDADPLVDSGYLSQIRITGIGGNETTGQQRVPVIITSVRDDTVGRTVRGVDMFQASSGNTTAPAAGDGGVILFGALGLSDYNLWDPRDGSIIDNADIRYLTRIEQQGGGWVYNVTGGGYADRIGNDPITQYNTAKAMTVSNSNLSTFSQVGFIAHPSGASQLAFFLNPPDNSPAFARNGSIIGQPTLTFFVNNTIANMPTGVRLVAVPSGDNSVTVDSPTEAVFLNNTFFNNATGISTEAPVFNNLNPRSHVHMLTMDNIFANSTVTAITTVGMSVGSQGQYNLFSSNASDGIIGNGGLGPDYVERQKISGSAQFQDAARGLFNLLPTSDAIDSSRSELGPLTLGTSLQPIVTQVFDARAGIRRATGRTNASGGLGSAASTGDIVSLPGFALRNFEDQWVPALTGTAGAIPGPSTNAGGTYSYTPIQGERDQAGFLRVDDPARANVGFGSRPFFDIGASEYRRLDPPQILDVTAIISTTLSPTGIAQVPFYSAGNILGANQTPRQIIIQFDERLDQATVNNKTIILQAAGGDGIFDNGNDRLLDLSGKLFYDATSRTVAVALADSNLSLGNDVYRIQVFGSGGDVIRDPEGLPLDGENTVGGRAEGASLLLPSGDGFPGGNFFLTFTIDTNPPIVVAGSFNLAAASDSGARDNVTNVNRPSFQGTISDIAPPANPLLGQTVLIDVSTLGDGNFDRLGVARGTTDANGNFTATYGADQVSLFDSAYNVGLDGILGTSDDSGQSVARVRIVDQSGNVSNLGDPNALVKLVVDTKGPRVVSTSPLFGAQASASNGVIAVAIAVTENIAPASLNANSVRVTRAGGDGILGNGNDVAVAIDATSLRLENLGSSTGSQILRFNIVGATASDLYRVTLVGTGANALMDVATNAIDGESPPLPSGNGIPGGDFNLDFVVFNPVASRLIYVAKTGSAAGTGSRTSPFLTITQGLASALPGDTVAVLPGVYTESIALKSLVKLRSASNSSTAASLIPGNALETIIRAPADPTGAATITVSGQDLFSIGAFQTEISGFSIAAPLVGDSARGPINNLSAAVSLLNADVLVSKNYIVDAGVGLQTFSNGVNARAPRLESNGFIGNVIGLTINDIDTASFSSNRNVQVINNTFAFNTYGLFEQSTRPAFGLQLADVVNNIFWQNADRLSGQRLGSGIVANGPNRMSIRNNLFSGNGPSDASPIDDLLNVGAGIVPGQLNANPDAFGNITGNPAFISPIDPRPEGSGPGNFFLGANYDISASSAAVDVALNALAPTLDFRSRGRVDIPNRGRVGVGPADIGAFEYNGSTGIVISAAANGSTATTATARSVAGDSGSKVTTSASVPSPSKVKANAAKAQAKAEARAKAKAKTKATANAPRVKLVSQGNNPSGPASLARRFNATGR